MLFGFCSGSRGFCYKTESDPFLFLLQNSYTMDLNTLKIIRENRCWKGMGSPVSIDTPIVIVQGQQMNITDSKCLENAKHVKRYKP